MARDHINAGDNHTVCRRDHGRDFAGFALILAGDDDDAIFLFDFELRHHSTSSASEMIFMKPSVRSSRVTGPKIRVPIGSRSLLIRTAALVSKRMMLPSLRRRAKRVRTIT